MDLPVVSLAGGTGAVQADPPAVRWGLRHKKWGSWRAVAKPGVWELALFDSLDDAERFLMIEAIKGSAHVDEYEAAPESEADFGGRTTWKMP